MISIIIPALNEADGIEETLMSIPRGEMPVEVIVVDGGSTDDTALIAARHAHVISSERGRARQMNAGAAEAKGDILLFLHADTILPQGALAAIREVLAHPSAEGGIFRLRFAESTPILHLYSLCSRIPSPKLGFGDRGLFVRRNVFDAVGGYRDIPIFEDLEIVRRLHARGGFRYLGLAVTTSARRFLKKGTIRQQLLNVRLWLYYLRGGDPSKAAQLYRYGSA